MPYKMLVLYVAVQRAEAIAYAQAMRRKHGFMVETSLIANGAEAQVMTDGEDRFRYNNRIYNDIITFADVNPSS
jgi:hypothetical protein